MKAPAPAHATAAEPVLPARLAAADGLQNVATESDLGGFISTDDVAEMPSHSLKPHAFSKLNPQQMSIDLDSADEAPEVPQPAPRRDFARHGAKRSSLAWFWQQDMPNN